MSQIITKPISKVKTGISSLTKSPVRFMISLGIGFALGVIADLIMAYIARNPSIGSNPDFPEYGFLSRRIPIGFPIYYRFPDRPWLTYDDAILLLITIFMLFTKKFVLTLGFFLGWYISSNEDFYGRIVGAVWEEAP